MVKIPKYLLNPAAIVRFTVAIATEKSNRIDNIEVRPQDIRRLIIFGLCMFLEGVGVLCHYKFQYVKVNHKNHCCVVFRGWCRRVEFCARQSPIVIFYPKERRHV